MRYLYWKYNNGPFALEQMKFDPTSEKTQLDFFPLAVNSERYGRYSGKYDPYLDNPLDRAGFHLTQSVERDSQKSKAASVCFDALEGLGWINRQADGKGTITTAGVKVAELDYFEKDFLPVLRKAVLNYGPFIGFLYECLNNADRNNEFRRADIEIGYPNTGETVLVDGQAIPLSVGSQADSITRTRSILIAWAITTGFIWPANEEMPDDQVLWHVEALKLIKEKKWTWSKFKLLLPPGFFEEHNINLEHPLSYKWMTKSTKALRERGQASIRTATLDAEEKVKSRRFAIVYSIFFAASVGKTVNFDRLVTEMKRYPDFFVVNQNSFDQIMLAELKIATAAGAIFINNNGELTPLVRCDLDHLVANCPSQVLDKIKQIAIKLTTL